MIEQHRNAETASQIENDESGHDNDCGHKQSS
jgi:hypothetical protein